MKQIISDAKETTGFGLPSLAANGAGLGMVTAGILLAHNGIRLIKQNKSFLVNLGLTALGFGAMCYVQHPVAKLALLGFTAYAALNTFSIAVGEVVAPTENTPAPIRGLSGMIPDSIKSKIAAFLPTFGSLAEGELMGGGMGADFNLDEPLRNIGNESENLMSDVNNEENTAGLGDAASSMI